MKVQRGFLSYLELHRILKPRNGDFNHQVTRIVLYEHVLHPGALGWWDRGRRGLGLEMWLVL
jgi:hypothetical protein